MSRYGTGEATKSAKTTAKSAKLCKGLKVLKGLPENTKFDGKLENWLLFSNKFEAEINSSDMVAETKFVYLNELLEPKVCQRIDGLQFTTEGQTELQSLDFLELARALQIWKLIHPFIYSKMYLIKEGVWIVMVKSHKSPECKSEPMEECKRKLTDKGQCFNCTGKNNRAARSGSRTNCLN